MATCSSRGSTLYSLGVIPVLMGLGHLVPAIGAIHTATGSYQFSFPLLGMIGTAAALVDSYDTYNDLSYPRRPSSWIWRPWIYSLWAVVLLCTYLSGLQTAIQMYRFSLIGLGWGTPCIPRFSDTLELHFNKPKTILREAKSIVVAVCMGYVTADTSTFYFCHDKATATSSSCIATATLQARSLALAVLYQFFRETACDVRDIAEDARDGMRTLPVRLGKTKTLLLMASVGALLDVLITKGVLVNLSGIQLDLPLFMGSFLRIGLMIGVYRKILQYPRENRWAWGVMSLLGLVPVLWAQESLLNS